MPLELSHSDAWYRQERRYRLGRDMAIGGAITWGLSYGATVFVAVITGPYVARSELWAVPVIGPILRPMRAPGSGPTHIDVLSAGAQIGSLAFALVGAGLMRGNAPRYRVGGVVVPGGGGLVTARVAF